jgi:cation diffusion facilitator CzcD-associated flavoprotein CzcO
MSASQAAQRSAETGPTAAFDAIVIGAGVSGLYQLYRLRELGLTVRVFEAGSGVGGTWYWNRYPGARFDSESWTYGYSFSEALLEEWNWEEHFAAQPETERYLNHVTDKFDLRRDIQFNSRVTAAHYIDDTRCWDIVLEDGRRLHRAPADHRDRRALGGDDAGDPRGRDVSRPVLPHALLAAGAGCL